MLTEREKEVLNELRAANRNLIEVGFRDGWARPMDCGGRDGSYHGKVLRRLVVKGLVDRKGWKSQRHVNWYMINDAGRAALKC